MVSFTHGEGFGRPLLEATMVGLPIIASNWSGQLDFLPSDKAILLGGEMVQVPKSQHWQDIIIPQSQWFNVNEADAAKYLTYVYEDLKQCTPKAKTLMDINRSKFTLNLMTKKLDELMEKYLKDVPQQVGLQLPKLKKVNKTEPPKIQLPKLKKLQQETA
tara:strand:- start:131 stop:610 length:480 start_codon:yes stop_codon:yes gene_type:complete